MYRGIAHLSEKAAGKFGKEKWGKGLFLMFSSTVWAAIGGTAAVCLLVSGFSVVSFADTLAFLLFAAVFPGFYGGILYLFRQSQFSHKTIRRSGCVLYDFCSWKIQHTQGIL